MKFNPKTSVLTAVAAGALVLAGTTGAVAGSLITGADIKDGSVHKVDLGKGVNAALRTDALTGAVYRVENYKNGGGGSATVACADDPTESQKYTAIAGGVQGSNSGTTEKQDGFLVSSSFPGRMDWDTGLPKPDRLDGWIVFGNSQYTDTLKVWALCVPNTSIAVQQVDLDN